MISKIYFSKKSQITLEFQEEDIMISGDINGVLDPKKERSRTIKSGKLLQNAFPIFGISEIKRHLEDMHPKDRDCTFFPNRHRYILDIKNFDN